MPEISHLEQKEKEVVCHVCQKNVLDKNTALFDGMKICNECVDKWFPDIGE